MFYSWQLTITDGKRTRTELYDTKKEAVHARALWSLMKYERTGNFDHGDDAKITRVRG